MREPSGVDAKPQPPASAATSASGVSAILLSWRRPKNIERIVAELRTWKRIGEIMVWNNNPDQKLSLAGATVIDSGRNFGCLARYGLVALAENDTIWFQDDDLLVTEAQFERIFAAYLKDAGRIYGCRGRNLQDGAYVMREAYGDCDIIVGQTMLFHRSLLNYLFRFLGSIPIPARADDIAFSLACPSRHVAVDVEPITDIGSDDEHALWLSPGHHEARQAQVDLMLPFCRKTGSHG